MRTSSILAAVVSALAASAALLSEYNTQSQFNLNELRLVETASGAQQWITEADKLQLKRAGKRFMDITEIAASDDAVPVITVNVTYPAEVQYIDEATPLLSNISIDNMKVNLQNFTSFYTRYYKSTTGADSSQWLFDTVKAVAAVNPSIKVFPFHHPWPQTSLIARIPGLNAGTPDDRTVVVGAHQDSINLIFPSFFGAPGADDDGSGTVTILETFRTLISNGFTPNNTVEFHWYSAEEGGLLGSQAIFSEYAKRKIQVAAMLQQDMTGFVKKTLDGGRPESLGVITDFVHPGLTEFIKKIVTSYSKIPFVETECGYACSDHASAAKVGYPSAFVIESTFKDSNPFIHSTRDTIDRLSFEHMAEHAKLTLGFVYELGNADLTE
ncbi:uncharacterized protein V2V93DRAFT_335073 [Kockiozyma suomiensis]|uniref:uncharacterized protein n=1 Tax=Kockiozyma suomiensis TaxID=1337062 RepID=UPI003342F0D3